MATLKPYADEVKDTAIDALKANLKGVIVLTSTVQNEEDEVLGEKLEENEEEKKEEKLVERKQEENEEEKVEEEKQEEEKEEEKLEEKKEEEKEHEKLEKNVEEVLATNMAEEGKGSSDENSVDVMFIVMELNGDE
ncbi:hypothetical protein KY285_007654 [Solanum tuberosum]|nr:hypothetical protein KY285_007654 [Solanum tuberosum]